MEHELYRLPAAILLASDGDTGPVGHIGLMRSAAGAWRLVFEITAEARDGCQWSRARYQNVAIFLLSAVSSWFARITIRNPCMRMALAVIALVLVQTGPVPRRAAVENVKNRVLTCQVASGIGWIFGSTRTMQCTHHPNEGSDEEYQGSILPPVSISDLGQCVLVGP